MRTVAVVTVSRSDYGLYLSILKRIRASNDLDLRLLVGGTHLAPAFGETIADIQRDGFEIAERVDTLPGSDSREDVAVAIGTATAAFARALQRAQPDILVVLGDRFDMFAAAVAALPLTIPVAHIHGGELTEGAIDDTLRHCITKLSHLHFVANQAYARRVMQLGEEPWRVTVSGAPGLDDLTAGLSNPRELEARLRLRLRKPVLLVTYHPVTLEPALTAVRVRELMAALRSVPGTIVFTGTNVDTGHRTIRAAIEEIVSSRPDTFFVENLGRRDYASLMAIADVMVGNSSSGIIEAPSVGLPVVNVGARQRSRLRGVNVIDVDDDAAEIAAAIRRALIPRYRGALRGAPNPYGDGHAAERIVQRLATVALDRQLLMKRFTDEEQRD